MSWQQQIEAQIASLREIANDQSYCGEPGRKNTCAAAWRMDDAADSLQALLDVAAAAEKVIVPAVGPEADRDFDALCDAIDKLRELDK